MTPDELEAMVARVSQRVLEAERQPLRDRLCWTLLHRPGRTGGRRCTREAEAIIRAVCVHEHLNLRVPVCRSCLDGGLAGDAWCSKCKAPIRVTLLSEPEPAGDEYIGMSW